MGMPELGSKDYEKMIDNMRFHLKYKKAQLAARTILKEQGRDFDVEFEKWKERQKRYA